MNDKARKKHVKEITIHLKNKAFIDLINMKLFQALLGILSVLT
jgi:hypothetical protein